MQRAESVLFAPFRQIGVICNSVRPVYRIIKQARTTHSIVCAVDNTVVNYLADNLTPIAVSDPLDAPVTAVTANIHEVFAAHSDKISVLPFCRKVKDVFTIGAITRHLLLLGEHLVAVDEHNHIHVLDAATGESTLHLEWDESFEVTAIAHPSTYINKVVLGSSDGRLRLLNIRTGKIVHEFKSTCPKNSRVIVMEQSPALDVIAVGHESGRVQLRHLKKDELVMEFRHEQPVTAVGFRTDGEPLMTSADGSGVIAVWDLDRKSLIGRITDAHTDAVHFLHFIDGEAIMLSGSEDNSLRTWVLDQPDGMPRQNVVTEGHAAEVTAVIFANQHHMISSSLDETVRMHSVISDRMRNKLGNAGIMSRRKAKKKHRDMDSIRLRPIVELALGWTREAAWDNVLARHEDELVVTTWTSRDKGQGTHCLLPDRFKKDSSLQAAKASALALSPCGNFAIIGYSTGHVDQFNVQSGRHVRTFMPPVAKKDKKAAAKPDRPAHSSEVRVLSPDARGHELVTIAADGRVRFWSMRGGALLSSMQAPPNGRVAKAASCVVNALIAIVLEKYNGDEFHSASVTLLDTLCKRVVRSFAQPEKAGRITAVSFTPDGKWVLVADEVAHIRVWDIATSTLIDVLVASSPCRALAFNTTGEYVATCHKNQKAVYVWASKNHFTAPQLTKPLPLDYAPSLDEDNLDTSMNMTDDDDEDEEEGAEKSEREEVDSLMVRLSGLNPSRWANLPDLATIKERNKPLEPASKPKRAPFFLAAAPTLSGFEFEKEEDTTEAQRKIAKAKRSLLELESAFSAKLRNASCTSDLLDAFEDLKKMTLSAIDFQIRTLTAEVLAAFLRMLLAVLKSRRDFDLVQAYLATTLNLHRSLLWKRDEGEEESGKGDKEDADEVGEILERILAAQKEVWTELDELFVETSAIVAFAKTALV